MGSPDPRNGIKSLGMGQEIELKLELSPDAKDELERQPWFGSAERRSQRQVSTYYDTPDRRLRGRGYTLRVRSVGDRFVQTVKSLDGGAGLFARGEWEYQIERPEPDVGRLSSTPLGHLEIDELEPVLESEIERTACRLHEHHSEIEVDVDDGRLTANGRELAVCEIEIELIRGEPQSAVALARRIAREVPVKLGVMSKAERGFALADGSLGKVAKAEPVPVRPGMSVAEGFEAIVAACVRHFRLNEPLVIETREMNALHQARVAMRRLRSALTLFRSAVTDPEFMRLRDELRWFTGKLGDARNLDVYLQGDLSKNERRRLKDRREAAYDDVAATLDSTRFRRLILDLVAWSAVGEWRKHANASKPLRPYVSRRIGRLWGRVSRAESLARMDEHERHRLRIQIKKLRYALEFVEALHAHESKRQKAFATAVEELQEALGHLNDAVVARSLVTADVWPIEPVRLSDPEHKLLDEAERAIGRLRKIGPYWRSDAD